MQAHISVQQGEASISISHGPKEKAPCPITRDKPTRPPKVENTDYKPKPQGLILWLTTRSPPKLEAAPAPHEERSPTESSVATLTPASPQSLKSQHSTIKPVCPAKLHNRRWSGPPGRSSSSSYAYILSSSFFHYIISFFHYNPCFNIDGHVTGFVNKSMTDVRWATRPAPQLSRNVQK